jgi:hypothetical protein
MEGINMKKYNWNIWNQNPNNYLDREMTDDNGDKVKLVSGGESIRIFKNNEFIAASIDINNLIYWLNANGVN